MSKYYINYSFSSGWGIECELLTPSQCKAKCPLIEVNDIIGGIWIPKDGVADPELVCNTLVQQARDMGVTVVENCAITKVVQTNGVVSRVETETGNTDCSYFVNCGGFWARKIGLLSEPVVKVPLHAAEHYYLHTAPIAGLDPMMPVVRDMDGNMYFRENNGRLLGGGFEAKAKPAFEDQDIPGKIFVYICSPL